MQQQKTVVAGQGPAQVQNYPVQQQYPYQQNVVTQQPVVVVQNTRYSGQREGYPSKVGMVFGIMLIVGGSLCIIFNIVGISIGAEESHSGTSIWVGISYIITGSLTVSASKAKVTGLIVGSMVMAILSSIFSLGVIGSASAGLAKDKDNHRLYKGLQLYFDPYNTNDYDKHYDAKIATNGILIALGLICGLVCIGISVLDCVGLCSSTNSGAQPGHIIHQQPGNVIVTTTHQQGGVVNPGMQYPMQPYPQQHAPPPGGYMGPNPPPYAPQATPAGFTPEQPGPATKQ